MLPYRALELILCLSVIGVASGLVRRAYIIEEDEPSRPLERQGTSDIADGLPIAAHDDSAEEAVSLLPDAASGLRLEAAVPDLSGRLTSEEQQAEIELAALPANIRFEVRSRRSWMLSNLVACLVWMFVVLLVAQMRPGSREAGNGLGPWSETDVNGGTRPSDIGGGDWSFKVWKHELFDLHGQAHLCLWAGLFPGIRWAESLNRAGLLGYWSALALFMVLAAIDWLALAWSAGMVLWGSAWDYILAPPMFLAWVCCCTMATWIFAAALSAYYRSRLRRKFHMEEEDGHWPLLTDCFVHFGCCGLCAIVQEARHVQAAWRAGHTSIAMTHFNRSGGE